MDGQNPNSSKPKGNLKNTKKTCGSYVFDSGMKTSIFRSWRWGVMDTKFTFAFNIYYLTLVVMRELISLV